MHRVYRLSKIGARLPLHHGYGPVKTIHDCQPGFEVYKGPIYSIADTVGPGLNTLGEGDFTPAAGYDLMLLIDARNVQPHRWNPFTWHVISTSDVEGVRSLPVADLHAWLREQPARLDPEGRLGREAVVAWVDHNRRRAASWLEQHSQGQPVVFEQTLEPMKARREG